MKQNTVKCYNIYDVAFEIKKKFNYKNLKSKDHKGMNEKRSF